MSAPLERWTKVGVDGFVLTPIALSLGTLIAATVGMVVIWGVMAAWWLANPDALPVVAGLFLLSLLILASGVQQVAVRTTLTVRGNTMRIERSYFGVFRRTYDVKLMQVQVRPGKGRPRRGSYYVWIDLQTPSGSFHVGLGSYAVRRGDAILDETLALIDSAKRNAIQLPGESEPDPEARRALDALRAKERN